MGASRFLNLWIPVHRLLAGALVFSSLGHASEDSASPKAATTTTAPIYLPHYDSDSWSLVRGSIIGLVREHPAPSLHGSEVHLK